MKRILIALIAMSVVFVMTGCGHSMLHVDRGVGMKLRIPTPDGGSIIDFAIGQIDSSTAVMRGNTAFNTSSTGGASITGTANMTQQIQMTTGTQLNEGNIVKVMESPSCPAEAKVEIAKSLVKSDAPKVQPTVSKTPSAAVATGEKATDVALAKGTVATIVEAAPKILESSAKPIEATAKPIEATTKPVADTLNNTVTEASDMLEGMVGKVIIGIIILGVLLIVVGSYFLYRYVQYRIRKKNAGKTDEQSGSESKGQPETKDTEPGHEVDTGTDTQPAPVQQETGTSEESKVPDASPGDTPATSKSVSEVTPQTEAATSTTTDSAGQG